MSSFKYKKNGEWFKVGLGKSVATFKGRYGDVMPQAGDYADFYAGKDLVDGLVADTFTKTETLSADTKTLLGLDSGAVPDEAFGLIKSIVDENALNIANGVKIATGSYIGTGTYGADNPCSLTFDFVPKFFAVPASLYNKSITIRSDYTVTDFIPLSALTTSYQTLTFGVTNSIRSIQIKKSEDGTTVWWYSTDSQMQQDNGSGYTYYWIAIG